MEGRQGAPEPAAQAARQAREGRAAAAAERQRPAARAEQLPKAGRRAPVATLGPAGQRAAPGRQRPVAPRAARGQQGAAGGAGAKGTGGTAGAAGSTGTGGAGGAPATCGNAVGGGDQCSSVTGSATGPCVTPVMATGPVPTALGGTFTAGTYELTATNVYVTSDAGQNGGEEVSRQTFIVSNVTSSGFTLQQIEASGTATSRDEGTVAISGTTATFTKACPPPGDGGDQGGAPCSRPRPPRSP